MPDEPTTRDAAQSPAWGDTLARDAPLDLKEFEDLPSPPDGYGPLREYDPAFPLWLNIFMWGGVLAFLTVAALAWFLGLLFVVTRYPVIAPWATATGFSQQLLYGVALVVGLGIVLGHEFLHIFAAWRYDWRVTFTTVWYIQPGVVPLETFQTRRETAIFFLAPTIGSIVLPVLVYGGALVLGLYVPVLLAAVVFLGSFVNLLAVSDDLKRILELVVLPAGALLYNTKSRSLVTVPEQYDPAD
jgi:hypothetical protein